MGIPTFEEVQNNPMTGEERELEDCGHAVHRNWCAACVKDRCARKHLQVEPFEEENRERTKSSWVSFDCVFMTPETADTFPIPIFRHDGEVKRQCRTLRTSAGRNTSMRIKDNVLLFNWIPHLTMRFSNELIPDLRWRKTMA